MSSMFVKERFYIASETIDTLRGLKSSFGFNGLGEVTYYRTYSRTKADGSQEHWVDTIVRVVEGLLSIRKDHYVKNGLPWEEKTWQKYAREIALSMFHMEFLPPGRGLWALGSEFVYKRGSAALYNCGAVDTKDLVSAAEWTMDMLMHGVGVGFNTAFHGVVCEPDMSQPKVFVIPDSREGWAESLKLLLHSFIPSPHPHSSCAPYHTFDYSKIRPAGARLKGFGGTASGPEPLKKMHSMIEHTLRQFIAKKISRTQCVVDVMNHIGVCVVAGNIRRSAQIALGDADDMDFIKLKDYELHPERVSYGFMSNNSTLLKETRDFEEFLPEIAKHIRINGEPGCVNVINMQKYGRFGKEMPDKAFLCNPCGEVCLESFELCNLAEVFPSRCASEERLIAAVKFATFYASTVALLPTHRPETNTVLARNRRIAVSMSGIAEYRDAVGATLFTRLARKAYRVVREENLRLAEEAGVRESIRVTAVKPSGTISILAGVSSGMHYPTFKYAIRRIRIGKDSPIVPILVKSGVPHEDDVYTENTLVFEFPIDQGSTRTAREVSAWEQFSLLAMLQREWADNMVSCTIYFDREKEGEHIEDMLAEFLPVVKSVSMLPHTEEGAYAQMPFEGITKEEYDRRVAQITACDWSPLCGSDGMEERYCTNETCMLSLPATHVSDEEKKEEVA